MGCGILREISMAGLLFLLLDARPVCAAVFLLVPSDSMCVLLKALASQKHKTKQALASI